jgi:hypothetical protein
MATRQLPPSPQRTTSQQQSVATTMEDLHALLCSKFDSKIREYGNGDKTLDGINVVEQFYHAYLASANNISHKRKLKKAIYNYILVNKLKVIGGRFGYTRLGTVRILYYCN